MLIFGASRCHPVVPLQLSTQWMMTVPPRLRASGPGVVIVTVPVGQVWAHNLAHGAESRATARKRRTMDTRQRSKEFIGKTFLPGGTAGGQRSASAVRHQTAPAQWQH